MTQVWTGSREQFESKPQWRATISRGGKLSFILEGKGEFAGKYYEYPEGSYPTLNQPVDLIHLSRQLESGELNLLAGSLP